MWFWCLYAQAKHAIKKSVAGDDFSFKATKASVDVEAATTQGAVFTGNVLGTLGF